MTVDLFAASFICRDAELGSILQIGRREAVPDQDPGIARPSRWRMRLAAMVQALAVMLGRAETIHPA